MNIIKNLECIPAFLPLKKAIMQKLGNLDSLYISDHLPPEIQEARDEDGKLYRYKLSESQRYELALEDFFQGEESEDYADDLVHESIRDEVTAFVIALCEEILK